MKLREGLWLVGSGQFGFEMTHRLDCNIYLIGDGDEYALIDAGAGVDTELLLSSIASTGVPASRIRKLLLTHAHADHAAGAAALRQRLDLWTIAAKDAGPWIESADIDRTSIGAAVFAGVYPPDYLYPPCPIDETVSDGDIIEVGALSLKVIETPGHARGHISFALNEGDGMSLFAGDAIFAGGKIVLQQIWDCEIDAYARTIARLNDLRIKRLYPGHGPFLLSAADRHIAKAYDCFEKLELPPNL
ncbi:MBL fold metallo-hydrolase [Paenibacillus agaridevorans]|uniref:MBL fold metallo-hydrolase n=1 Tax=Paenibacillus agaridevorans TaxID=171404 RepID=UPI001BE432F9|nr:MBL fold metallo-hydrolase [Paenibacillus agaridevorans]